jgi:hypothetical protein
MRKKKVNSREASLRLEHDAWLRKRGLAPDQLKAKLPHSAKGRRLGIHSIPDYTIHQGLHLCSNNVSGVCEVRKENTYTGTEILGIGVLHKSNLIPIRKDSNAAKEIASMRR